MRIAVGFLILVSFLAFLFGPVQAEAKYSEKAIYTFDPAPGGSSDIIIRTVALVAKNYFPKPMIVVTRDGANGMIAPAELTRTKDESRRLQGCQGAGGFFLSLVPAETRLSFRQKI